MTRGIARRFLNYCSSNACPQSEAVARLELTRGPLSRGNSKVLSARVSTQTVDKLARVAAAHRVPTHVFMRQALTMLAAGASGAAAPDPEGVIADVTKALGLPIDSPAAAVLAAVKDLLDSLAASVPDEALHQNPDPPPATQLTSLSAADRASLARRGITTDRQFAEAKSQVKRV